MLTRRQQCASESFYLLGTSPMPLTRRQTWELTVSGQKGSPDLPTDFNVSFSCIQSRSPSRTRSPCLSSRSLDGLSLNHSGRVKTRALQGVPRSPIRSARAEGKEKQEATRLVSKNNYISVTLTSPRTHSQRQAFFPTYWDHGAATETKTSDTAVLCSSAAVSVCGSSSIDVLYESSSQESSDAVSYSAGASAIPITNRCSKTASFRWGHRSTSLSPTPTVTAKKLFKPTRNLSAPSLGQVQQNAVTSYTTGSQCQMFNQHNKGYTPRRRPLEQPQEPSATYEPPPSSTLETSSQPTAPTQRQCKSSAIVAEPTHGDVNANGLSVSFSPCLSAPPQTVNGPKPSLRMAWDKHLEGDYQLGSAAVMSNVTRRCASAAYAATQCLGEAHRKAVDIINGTLSNAVGYLARPVHAIFFYAYGSTTTLRSLINQGTPRLVILGHVYHVDTEEEQQRLWLDLASHVCFTYRKNFAPIIFTDVPLCHGMSVSNVDLEMCKDTRFVQDHTTTLLQSEESQQVLTNKASPQLPTVNVSSPCSPHSADHVNIQRDLCVGFSGFKPSFCCTNIPEGAASLIYKGVGKGTLAPQAFTHRTSASPTVMSCPGSTSEQMISEGRGSDSPIYAQSGRSGEEHHFPFLRRLLCEDAAGRIASDAGWGCMIRATQMAFCQALVTQRLSRDWRRSHRAYHKLCQYEPPASPNETVRNDAFFEAMKVNSQLSEQANGVELRYRSQLSPIFEHTGPDSQKKKSTIESIISLFADHPAAPLSVHNIAVYAYRRFGTPVGDWLGPTSCAQAGEALMTESFPYLFHDMRPVVFPDGLVVHSRVRQVWEQKTLISNASGRTTTPAALLIICMRLGTQRLNAERYQVPLSRCFALKQFQGMTGGGSSTSAHYFLGECASGLLFFDPHTSIQPAFPTTEVAEEALQLIEQETITGNNSFAEKTIFAQSHGFCDFLATVLQTKPGVFEDFFSFSPPPFDNTTESRQKFESITTNSATLSFGHLGSDVMSSLADSTSTATVAASPIPVVPWKKVGPSMALYFLCKNEVDYENLVVSLIDIAKEAKCPELFEMVDVPFNFDSTVMSSDAMCET